MVTVKHERVVTMIGGREVTVHVIIGCAIGVTVMLVRVVTVMHEREVTVRVFIGCAIRGSAEMSQIHTQW